MRTFAGEQRVWACEGRSLPLTDEEERQYGVVTFRGIPINPLT
jgi:hypothetical protein